MSSEKKLPLLRLRHQSKNRIQFARKLRGVLTKEEKVIWEKIRNKKIGCKWRRQVPLGVFIADFCCMKHRVIVEIDGDIHKALHERDRNRDEILVEGGFKIMRVTNEDVTQGIESVLKRMRDACKTSPPNPSPS